MDKMPFRPCQQREHIDHRHTHKTQIHAHDRAFDGSVEPAGGRTTSTRRIH